MTLFNHANNVLQRFEYFDEESNIYSEYVNLIVILNLNTAVDGIEKNNGFWVRDYYYYSDARNVSLWLLYHSILFFYFVAGYFDYCLLPCYINSVPNRSLNFMHQATVCNTYLMPRLHLRAIFGLRENLTLCIIQLNSLYAIKELHILNSIVLLEYFLTISLNIFKYIKNFIFENSRKPKNARRCKWALSHILYC